MVLKSALVPISGSYTSYGIQYPFNGYSSRDDLHVSVSNSPGADHPFYADHLRVKGSIWNNTEPSVSLFFDNFPSSLYSYSLAYLDLPEGDGFRLRRLLANSNPATPEFLMPAFIAELRDLPDMIRQGGRIADAIRRRRPWQSLIRPDKADTDLASAHLALQFGWVPFLSDLSTLLTFQSSVEKTRQKFQQLESGKGLRVRMPLGQVTEKSADVWPLWSGAGWGPYWTVLDITRTTSSWGVVRWKPNPSGIGIPRSDLELRRHAAGFNASSMLIGAWESLPWSWLIDYFVNVGDLIQSGNRTVAYPASATVMTRSEIKVTHMPYGALPDRHICTAGEWTAWSHRRATLDSTSTDPSSYLSFFRVLNPKQLSILGSLAIIQMKSGRQPAIRQLP